MPIDAYKTSELPLPDTFWQGITQFNQGDFYACHDTLEAIWMEAETPLKPFYQGILQIAVAFYHLGNHNWQGAAILLGEGMRRLYPFEPSYSGVDVENLIDQGEAWLKMLQDVGHEGIEPLAIAIASADITPIHQHVDRIAQLPHIRIVES